MDCVFCKIAQGEIPCYKIYEDNDVMGFLDVFPLAKGQALVIPKKHIAPFLFKVDDEIYTKLMLATKKVVNGVDKSIKPLKTGMAVEGLELEHVHIKIFPLDERGFKIFCSGHLKFSAEEMEKIAEDIKSRI